MSQPELDAPFDDDHPHGWVQWKGTDVCMDLHCACGETTHIDGGFAYVVQCHVCGAHYAMNGNVMAHPISGEEAKRRGTDVVVSFGGGM